MSEKSRLPLPLVTLAVLFQLGAAHAATVVALGASNTAGKGVSADQAYPAQLETLLRAQGLDVNVINAGVSGDTTGGMMARLESAVPKGTKVVILQPGGNDLRKGAPNYTAELQRRLMAMGVRVVMLPNGMFRGKPHQADGMHLTAEGYHMLAQQLAGPVASALRK
ncbi:GDSL-type esterase/lipase family protein [Bradyrhizobium sp. ARR65]|uniref:GDSL-type esterase/lipase family protein n=1 Tax=Bradyrhizobium sp. ARR65 TaxID=1040989 RepID=UPI0004640C03|nr:GDSL-type esterase/lipase family protein [Bradyrhizobium sp. ARR65]